MNDDNNALTKMRAMKMCIQEILRWWRDACMSACRLIRRRLATAVCRCKQPGSTLGCGLPPPEVGDATHHVRLFSSRCTKLTKAIVRTRLSAPSAASMSGRGRQARQERVELDQSQRENKLGYRKIM